MKDFESAFLGLILAGVLMMVVGVGLMMSFDRSRSPDARVSLAERQTVEHAPSYAAGPDNDKPATPSVR